MISFDSKWKNTLWIAILFLPLFSACRSSSNRQDHERIVQFIYISDTHFGVNRNRFRGEEKVPSHVVNRALVHQINTRLPETEFPADEGVRSGKKVDWIDFVISSGDMVNRAQPSALTAAESWNQFKTVYIEGLEIRTGTGEKAPLYITPGNHDISNAIGHRGIPDERVDPSVMASIYNYALVPDEPRTAETYNYHTDKVNYCKTVKGVHFLFLNIWPDTETRTWITSTTADLTGPVLLITHDEPDIEAKHLTDRGSVPAEGRYEFGNKFENLVTDLPAEGATTSIKPTLQHEQLTSFLLANPHIKAYFHGNSNMNEFYTYTGEPVAAGLQLPVFRVDSPINGYVSSKDETKLSFQVVTIDTSTQDMTVRECFWNGTANDQALLTWGESITIPMR